MVTNRPLVSRPIEDTKALIEHLSPMLQKVLSNEISRTYFGDIGVYLPTHFIGPRKDNRAILVLSPAFDRVVEGSRVASQETRLIGVDIIALVNITPDFRASPDEAYGERKLASLMATLRDFLSQQENVDLGGRVQYFSVGDISWHWAQRDKLSLRGAVLEVTAKVKVSRQKNLT